MGKAEALLAMFALAVAAQGGAPGGPPAKIAARPANPPPKLEALRPERPTPPQRIMPGLY